MRLQTNMELPSKMVNLFVLIVPIYFHYFKLKYRKNKNIYFSIRNSKNGFYKVKIEQQKVQAS